MRILFQKLAVLSFLIILSSCATAPAVSVCFSPGGGCLGAIAEEIAQAKTDLRIQAYSLNAKTIADAVIKAKESNVNVEIILDGGSATAHNNATFFSSLNGIPTWLDRRHTMADSNVIIIDEFVVITGSFKFSKEAEDRYAENLMFIRSASVAGAYLENWNLHRSHAEEFKPADGHQPARKDEKRPVRKKKTTKSR